jgi:hypothetical protein
METQQAGKCGGPRLRPKGLMSQTELDKDKGNRLGQESRWGAQSPGPGLGQQLAVLH